MTCEQCGQTFEAKRSRRFCAPACWYARASTLRKGTAPVAALVSRAAEQKRKLRADLRQTFGHMRQRDKAIFRAAYVVAYRRGYARGRASAHQAPA